MNKAERQLKILDFMYYNNNAASLERLKEICGVTAETIRKDLIEMEAQRKIHRVLGGAVLEQGNGERPFTSRYNENLMAKMEIAKTVSAMIDDKDFIAMDSGSTNLCLAINFPKKVLSVLTNSLDIAKELSKREDVRVFVAGGELRERNMSMTGENTEKVIKSYHVKKVFLTSEGLSLSNGIMDAHESECRVKRAMMGIGNERYLLVDHTKFSVITPIVLAPVMELTAIITDSQIDPAIVERYREAGLNIVVSRKLLDQCDHRTREAPPDASLAR